MVNKLGAPQLMQVFGQRPITLPGVKSPAFTGGIAAHATSPVTVAMNGINQNDRVAIDMLASAGTSTIMLSGAEAVGANSLQVRFVNGSSSAVTPGARNAMVTVLENQSYRQVFAVSAYMGDDTLLCGVDAQTGSATIFKTVNAFGTAYPVWAVPGALAVRQFLAINSTGTQQIAVCADTGKVIRTSDSGDTWTDVGRLGSETALLCAEQQGGEGGGTGVILVGTATGHIWYSGNGGIGPFSDKGQVAAGYDQVWGLIYLSGSGAAATYLAFLNDSSGVLSPAVYEVTNNGADAALKASLGDPGQVFQGFIKTLSGAVLVGLTAGNIFRGVAPYTDFVVTTNTAAVVPSESKPRAFAQWADGTIWMVGQDRGYIWRSDDDGASFVREHRIGYLDTPISLRAIANEAIFIGCGQGFATNKPFKASVYRALRSDYA